MGAADFHEFHRMGQSLRRGGKPMQRFPGQILRVEGWLWNSWRPSRGAQIFDHRPGGLGLLLIQQLNGKTGVEQHPVAAFAGGHQQGADLHAVAVQIRRRVGARDKPQAELEPLNT